MGNALDDALDLMPVVCGDITLDHNSTGMLREVPDDLDIQMFSMKYAPLFSK